MLGDCTMKLIIIIISIIICVYFVFKNDIVKIENFKKMKSKKGIKNYVDHCNKTNISVSYNSCKHLFSKKSKYQKIDVFHHPTVGNILVIDDDLQITSSDEKNYHEMIAHVPLNYIPDAKNALIIGGGDGGTLTEVLKHKNLKNIINVEIDQEVINASKKYFPNIANSFDDKRAIVQITDAKKWVDQNSKKISNFFDVIILDLTDFGASDSVMTDDFFDGIKKLLKNTGILVLNFESLGWYRTELKYFKHNLGHLFKYIYIYQIYQPTYHTGHYSFAFLSNEINPVNSVIDWNKFYNKKINTNYYNKKIHYSSFALPNKLVVDNSNPKKRLGLLVSYDIMTKDKLKLDNLKNINDFFNAVLKIFKLSEIKRIEHKFSPQGITMVSLLKESHLSIHTWPEYGSACIDIFTCGKFRHNTNKQLMESLIKKYFNTTQIKVNQVDREV